MITKKNGVSQMKKLLTGFFIALLFLGCSSKGTEQNVEPKLVVNQSLESLTLNDQNGKPHTIDANTKTIIYAFSKDVGHTCNDFFATKSDSYLAENNAIFVADVSAAPSLIRSMFIMPGLKDFKHTVLVIDDKTIAAGYKSGQNINKILIVSLHNKVITNIKAVDTTDELSKMIEAK